MRGLAFTGDASRLTQACDGGYILGTWSQSSFVPGAYQHRLQRCTAAQVKRAHALAGIKFMPGQCQQINTQSVD